MFQERFEALCLLYSNSASPQALEAQAMACYAVADRIEADYLFAVLAYFAVERDWLEEALQKELSNECTRQRS